MKTDDRSSIGIIDKVSTKGWIVWGLAALFYFYEFWLQVSPGVMVPNLLRDFKVNALALGNLAAFYFYTYALMQIPAGVLIDRFGPRYLLSFAIIFCVVGCFCFGSAESLFQAKIGRAIIGIGSAFAVVSCLKVTANWFPPRYFALMTGFMITLGMTGAVIGEGPLALIVEAIDWRNTMFLLSGIGLILLIAIFSILRDHPSSHYIKLQAKHLKEKHFFSGLRVILRNKQVWLVSIYGGLMYAPTTAFGALWGVPFIMGSHKTSRPIAALLVSFIFIGWAVGAPLFGLYSNHIQKRKPPMYIGCGGALICLLLIIYVEQFPIIVDGILLFFFGFFSSGFLVAFTVVREVTPHAYAATAISFINMLNMLGGAIAQPVIGAILDVYWKGNMMTGAPVFAVSDYFIALIALPAAFVIALMFLPFIKETHCKMTGDQTL